jgi:soluble lytic murein transglycosylase
LPSFTSPVATKLWSMGLTEAAGRFDPGGFPRGTAGEAIWSARTLLTLGRPRMAIRLAEAAARQVAPRAPARVLPAEVREVLYPLPWPELVAEVAVACGIEGPLLAGLVREESRWQPTALSAVGARGLSQLMPATAAAAAARVGWPAPAADALFEPRVALSLGAVELGRLMVAFAGHRAAAVAGYNAGEAQARQWLEQCGTGCTEEHLVASITFDATRGYVAEVLAATEEYRELYPELETPTRGSTGP